MQANTGETAWVYFDNDGPNLLSSLHPTKNVWSHYYRDGDLLTGPGRNVETAPAAPGTTTTGEMEFPVPSPVKIVDHPLTRSTHWSALAIIDIGTIMLDVDLGEKPPLWAGEIVELVGFCLFDPGS